jgi:antitoxin component YwqK of YwqJK toxin-antitoxin module
MFIDGKENGEEKSYDENGQLHHICTFINGKLNGEILSLSR